MYMAVAVSVASSVAVTVSLTISEVRSCKTTIISTCLTTSNSLFLSFSLFFFLSLPFSLSLPLSLTLSHSHSLRCNMKTTTMWLTSSNSNFCLCSCLGPRLLSGLISLLV